MVFTGENGTFNLPETDVKSLKRVNMDAGNAFTRIMRYIICRIKPNSYTYTNQIAILITCSGRDMGAIINFSVIG